MRTAYRYPTYGAWGHQGDGVNGLAPGMPYHIGNGKSSTFCREVITDLVLLPPSWIEHLELVPCRECVYRESHS